MNHGTEHVVLVITIRSPADARYPLSVYKYN